MTIHFQQSIRRLGAILCLLLVATSTQVFARPHPALVQQGIIQMIDREALVLRIQPTGQSEPLSMVWNSRTSFMEGKRIVTAAELKKGSRVTVSYHNPLFGKRYASKIVIERGPPGATKN